MGPANGARTGPCEVIVIDDDADAACALTEMLSSEGYAARGFSLTAVGVRAAITARPAVVISDLSLAEYDGFLVARAIRQELGASVVLVAYSGWTTAECVTRSIEAGFDHFVPKTDPAKLLTIVASAAGRT